MSLEPACFLTYLIFITMLDTLITSKTRIKLLMRFFLNSNESSYLRNLESDFSESTNAIRQELNRFEKAGLLNSFTQGNKKMFQANTGHPLYKDIKNLLIKHIGLDQIIEKVINRLGDLQEVYIVGDFARGIDNSIIDLIFVGDNVNKSYLMKLVEKTEKLIKRKIRYLVYKVDEFERYKIDNKGVEPLLLWNNKA